MQLVNGLSLLAGEIMMSYLGGICLALTSALMAFTSEGRKQAVAIGLFAVTIVLMVCLFQYTVSNMEILMAQ